MNILIDTISPINNYVSYNKFRFIDIPLISIQQYFLNCTENVYFLLLSILQLMTYSEINLLPAHWSPSGPFSTFIPLLLCYIIELINIIYQYVTEFNKTYKFNYFNKINIIDSKKLTIKSKMFSDIAIGDLLIIKKNSIIPVDGVIFKVINDDYAKINLSNLNGESDIICKESLESIDSFCNGIHDIKIENIIDNSNSIKAFNATAFLNYKKYNIDHKYFTAGGSLNKGNDFILLVTQIGTQIRSYTSFDNEKIFSTNLLDLYISNSLIYIFIPMLLCYITSLTYLSVASGINFNLIYIIEKCIQSWILLNGIVPFSAKILIGVNRSVQCFLKKTDNVDYINPKAIDNFHQINTIICDKTGTLTKNELLLTHFSINNTILDNFETEKISFNFLYKIVLSLHHKNFIFNTSEDQIICEKFNSIGTCIEINKNEVTINKNYQSIKVIIINMQELEFDCERKKSSVIYHVPKEKKYYIVTKGSITAIESIIKSSDKSKFNNVVEQFNKKYPYLRTIAFAYRTIDYNPDKKPISYENSIQYNFISILGIQDELQDNCIRTVNKLLSNSKKISICTGDRYETALYIGNKLGICDRYHDMNTQINSKNDSTFIFSSHDIMNARSNYFLMKKFTNNLIKSNNFIAYSLIPKDKKFVTNIFEGHNVHTIAVGDGNNDVPMLKTSTLPVAINNNLNSNVINSSYISIKNFSYLTKVSEDSQFCKNINERTIFAVFYKTVLVNSLVFMFIASNSYNLQNVLFNFIQLQGHHLLWGVLPILTLNVIHNNISTINRKLICLKSIIYGLSSAFFIQILSEWNDNYEKRFVIFLLTVFAMNISFIIIIGCYKANICISLLSLIIGILYSVFLFE